MAKKISNKKPLSGNLVSHAENRTRTKQNPNLQTYKINGVKEATVNFSTTLLIAEIKEESLKDEIINEIFARFCLGK